MAEAKQKAPRVLIAETLETLRALVEAQTVECRGVMPTDPALIAQGRPSLYALTGEITHNHAICNGTGRILDPAYAAMLEVVRVGCKEELRGWGSDEDVYDEMVKEGKTLAEIHGEFNCIKCFGSLYQPRSWDGLPKGALAGALIGALEATAALHGRIATQWPPLSLRLQQAIIWESNDPDDAALDIVIEAMQKEAI